MENLRKLKKARRELFREVCALNEYLMRTRDFEESWEVYLETMNLLVDDFKGRVVYDSFDTKGREIFVDLENRLRSLIDSDEVDFEATSFWWALNDLKCSIKWVR
jgi:hypothetical protein